jgi:uncharacterized radical SAM superfamily Fe-S cluster-containing enzyme
MDDEGSDHLYSDTVIYRIRQNYQQDYIDAANYLMNQILISAFFNTNMEYFGVTRLICSNVTSSYTIACNCNCPYCFKKTILHAKNNYAKIASPCINWL